jgi:serine/threonine protein phosphatase PrpC
MTGVDMPRKVATAQITGARDCQEDTLAVHALAAEASVRAGDLLLVLADGMGGHAGGEVASRLVVDCFCATYSSSPKVVSEALRSSLEAANECLTDAVLDAPELTGMGATLVGCVIRENSLSWVSVGDSPLWVCRGSQLLRLNADHSMVPLLEDMVRTGLMEREVAQADPRRSLLRSALTGKTVALVDLCDKPVQLVCGDIVLLASDGIETLAEDALVALLQNAGPVSLDELAGKLLAAVEAVAASHQDNASVILYRC